jgi:hypothetical protein
MCGWRSVLNEFAVKPIQTFVYTTGKSSTDPALIIDAMDLLHSGVVDGFCIVSSDSDFTSLALRIREEGLYIMGVGRGTTPTALVSACDRFICTDDLAKNTPNHVDLAAAAAAAALSAVDVKPIEPSVITLVEKVFDLEAIETEGVGMGVQLGVLASKLVELDPTFNHKEYGTGGFKAFCDKLAPQFTITSVGTAHFLQRCDGANDSAEVDDEWMGDLRNILDG